MRRCCVALMIGALLFISGCGASEKQESLAANLAGAETFNITGEIIVDYGDRVSEFTLNYEGGAECGTITVLEPETIAGVQLELKDGSVMMKFDGFLLDSGELSGGLTPLSAIPTLANAMKNGYLTESGKDRLGDEDCTRLTYQPVGAEYENMLCSIWVADDTAKPVYGEISADGRTVIKCTFTEFSAAGAGID